MKQARRSAWAAARLAAGAAVVARLARGGASRPPVLPDVEPLPPGTVSVIVPARNEAARLGRLLSALQTEPTPHELIVVDDESTDATAAIAVAAGARVVAGATLPEGWVGKPWALQQGLDVASGQWVVCLDADAVPRPGLLAAVVRRAEADGWDLLSLAARFDCPGWIHLLVHPSMLTTLVYRFGPPGVQHDPSPGRVLANGQCLVVRRTRLVAAGGFTGAAGHLSDDVALARHLRGLGWRIGFLDGTPVLDVRMYESASEAWTGWGRSLPLRDLTRGPAEAADLAVIWLAQALPLARLITGRGDGIDVALALLRAGTLVATRRAYARGGAAYWASPLADVPVAARVTQAALRPEATWRGRTYALSASGVAVGTRR